MRILPMVRMGRDSIGNRHHCHRQMAIHILQQKVGHILQQKVDHILQK